MLNAVRPCNDKVSTFPIGVPVPDLASRVAYTLMFLRMTEKETKRLIDRSVSVRQTTNIQCSKSSTRGLMGFAA
jgi:hypothetical protein